jgi:hypothetical protein
MSRRNNASCFFLCSELYVARYLPMSKAKVIATP